MTHHELDTAALDPHETHPIAAEAERRFVRCLSPDCSAEEHADTAQWRLASAAHEAAYQQARALWRASRALASDPDAMMLRKGAEAHVRRLRGEGRARSRRLRQALAASVAAVALAWGGWQGGLFDALRPPPVMADFLKEFCSTYSADEIAPILGNIKANAPPEFAQFALQTAEQNLPLRSLEKVKARLG